jgi:hypothetical protein
MNPTTKKLLIAALASGAIFAVTHVQAQTTISDWTYATDTAATYNNSPAPDVGSGSSTALGMALEPTPAVGVAACDFVAGTGSSTSTPNSWRVRAGSTPTTGGTGANGWSSLAPIGTQGAEFLVSTVGFNNIQLSFDIDTTTQAEKNLAVYYTLNGTTWTPANITSAGVTTGAALVNNGSGSDANSVAATYVAFSATAGFNNGISVNFSSVTGANNNANFGVEIVNASTGADCVNLAGAALNNSSGNWRYDNVDFVGTPTGVPEPSDLVLVGIGLAGLTGLRRKLFPKS